MAIEKSVTKRALEPVSSPSGVHETISEESQSVSEEEVDAGTSSDAWSDGTKSEKAGSEDEQQPSATRVMAPSMIAEEAVETAERKPEVADSRPAIMCSHCWHEHQKKNHGT